MKRFHFYDRFIPERYGRSHNLHPPLDIDLKCLHFGDMKSVFAKHNNRLNRKKKRTNLNFLNIIFKVIYRFAKNLALQHCAIYQCSEKKKRSTFSITGKGVDCVTTRKCSHRSPWRCKEISRIESL